MNSLAAETHTHIAYAYALLPTPLSSSGALFCAKFRFRFQPCREALSSIMNERITRNRIREARRFRAKSVHCALMELLRSSSITNGMRLTQLAVPFDEQRNELRSQLPLVQHVAQRFQRENPKMERSEKNGFGFDEDNKTESYIFFSFFCRIE